MRPTLFVIQGAPASGKTTLCKKLRTDTNIPILGKDDVKELLFETLPHADREYSRFQGAVSFDMLYAFARTHLAAGHSVCIEGAFHTELSRANVQKIIDEYSPNYFEIFCTTDEAVRRKRFVERAGTKDRHAAHMDYLAKDVASDAITPADRYMPLALGEVMHLDTTNNIDEAAYNEMRSKFTTADADTTAT